MELWRKSLTKQIFLFCWLQKRPDDIFFKFNLEEEANLIRNILWVVLKSRPRDPNACFDVPLKPAFQFLPMLQISYIKEETKIFQLFLRVNEVLSGWLKLASKQRLFNSGHWTWRLCVVCLISFAPSFLWELGSKIELMIRFLSKKVISRSTNREQFHVHLCIVDSTTRNRWAQWRPEYSEEEINSPVAMVRMPWHYPINPDTSGLEIILFNNYVGWYIALWRLARCSTWIFDWG